MVYTNRVYQAVYDAGTLASISLATIPQEKGMQQGVVTVTPDGNTMYLTKWGISGDKKSAAIYSSSKTNDGWSEPVKLGESINANGANTQQPFVTADGKYLLFSSNRTGGQGGYDIWYAPLENGQPVLRSIWVLLSIPVTMSRHLHIMSICFVDLFFKR
jgi:Tol biopolymer transport system component